MIIFKELKISGFCAISNTVRLRLDSPGINIIRGRNGIGKSTIPNAFMWVLYGTMLKEGVSNVNTWPELRPDDYKGTCVEIEYDIEGINYRVIRCQSYKGKIDNSKGGDKLFYYISGKNMSLKGKVDTQSKIVNDLGVSLKLMRSSVVFGQKVKRLVKENSSDKKKILEEAFKLEFINESRESNLPELKRLSSEVSKLKSELESKEMKISSIKYVINQIKEHNLGYKKKIKLSIESLDKQIIENKVKLERAKKRVSEVKINSKSSIRKLNKVNLKIENLSEAFSNSKEVSNQLKTTKGIIKSLTTFRGLLISNKPDIKKVVYMINKTIDALKFNEGYHVKLSKLKSERDRYKSLFEANKYMEKDIQNYESNIERLKRQINNLSSGIPKDKSYSDKANELKKEKKARKILLSKVKPLEESEENLDWVLNEALGNKGLKNYIFEHKLSKLNEVFLAMSSIVGYTVKLTIDLSSKMMNVDTYIYYEGGWRKYEELSGGQQQIVDVVLAIGMFMVFSGNTGVNLLWGDELFDSLDSSNVDLVMELLKTINIQTLFIITHNENISGSNVIDIEQLIKTTKDVNKSKKKRQ